MMPKGVEHFCGAGGTSTGLRVKIPMMPKGVEHLKAVGHAGLYAE